MPDFAADDRDFTGDRLNRLTATGYDETGTSVTIITAHEGPESTSFLDVVQAKRRTVYYWHGSRDLDDLAAPVMWSPVLAMNVDLLKPGKRPTGEHEKGQPQGPKTGLEP